MKKIVFVLLVIMLLLALVSCGNDESFNTEDVVLSFGVVSDPRVTQLSLADATNLNFWSSLTHLRSHGKVDDEDGLDAVIVLGDLTGSGKLSDAKAALSRFTAWSNPAGHPEQKAPLFDVKKTAFLFCLGECDTSGTDSLTMNKLRTAFGDEYFTYDKDLEALDEGNRLCEVKGYSFIFLQPETKYDKYTVMDAPITYSETTKTWLKNTLDRITKDNPKQYVMVMTHPMIYDTVYGSTLNLEGDEYSRFYTTDLTDILSNYPQVITFSGHTRFPINDERSIMQTSFTSVGCGAENGMCIENAGYKNMTSAIEMFDSDEISTGLVVQVDGNGNMRIIRLDFFNDDESLIKDTWYLDAPNAKGNNLNRYTAERGSEENNKAPVFGEDALTFKYSDNGKSKEVKVTSKINYPEDDDLVHDILIEVFEEGTDKAFNTVRILSDFYSSPQVDMMSNECSATLGMFKRGLNYTIKVTAFDSWGASDTITGTLSFPIIETN